MHTITVAVFCILTFCLSASADWLDVKYTLAVTAAAPLRAATCSVGMWSASTIGLVTYIAIGWYVLPFELLGLFLGTLVATRRRTVNGFSKPAADPSPE